MSLIYEKKTDQKQQPCIEITGYEGKVSYLNIPEYLEETPVKSIGSGAFAGRNDLTFVQIPRTVEVLRRNSFYNCPNLKEISLFDRVEDYYDGVIRQCQSLTKITLFLTRNDFSVLKEMLSDNDRKLMFCLKQGEEEYRFVFPAYVYDFVEDVEARVLHHKIEGCGYAYRECVTRKGVDCRAYDALFPRIAQEDYMTAADIAFTRLMYPRELEQKALELYEAFLEKISGAVLRELLINKDVERLAYLTEHCLIEEEALGEALLDSARYQAAELGAMLLEYQRKHFSKVKERRRGNSFSLEEW